MEQNRDPNVAFMVTGRVRVWQALSEQNGIRLRTRANYGYL
jgi:hypothetical protein